MTVRLRQEQVGCAGDSGLAWPWVASYPSIPLSWRVRLAESLFRCAALRYGYGLSPACVRACVHAPVAFVIPLQLYGHGASLLRVCPLCMHVTRACEFLSTGCRRCYEIDEGRGTKSPIEVAHVSVAHPPHPDCGEPCP